MFEFESVNQSHTETLAITGSDYYLDLVVYLRGTHYYCDVWLYHQYGDLKILLRGVHETASYTNGMTKRDPLQAIKLSALELVRDKLDYYKEMYQERIKLQPVIE